MPKSNVSPHHGNVSVIAKGTDYYVSNAGSDSNSGTDPDSPWATLERVNTFHFRPGDTIHFKCGDTWRGQLLPRSGSESGYVEYTLYGTGNKPVIMGSVAKNDPSDWSCLENNIWGIVPKILQVSDTELVADGDFENHSSGWSLYRNASNGADATGAWTDADAYHGAGCYQINLVNTGSGRSDVQFCSPGDISLQAGKVYRLTFAAKSSVPAKIKGIQLIKNASPYTLLLSSANLEALEIIGRYPSPYTLYSSDTFSPTITSAWNTCTYYFRSDVTASDARLNFFLGGSGRFNTALYLDSVSLKECEMANFIADDVGNLIFNDCSDFGQKVWNEADMDGPNKFWYDPDNQTLKVYSAENPASLYDSIECVLTKYIIDNTNVAYVRYDGLHITHGGADGISNDFGLCHHIIISNCDISWIGGGFTKGLYNGRPARYGNGVQFWGDANNCTVENCSIWEVYDAAISPQCTVTNELYNIYLRNNTIRNFEYGLELWNRPSTSSLHDIYFENNVLKNAGDGWAHKQRPNPRASFLELHNNTSVTSNIFIRNNLFDTTEQYCINSLSGAVYNGIADMVLDGNTYYVDENKTFAVWVGGGSYPATAEGVAGFICATGKERNSKVYIFREKQRPCSRM